MNHFSSEAMNKNTRQDEIIRWLIWQQLWPSLRRWLRNLSLVSPHSTDTMQRIDFHQPLGEPLLMFSLYCCVSSCSLLPRYCCRSTPPPGVLLLLAADRGVEVSQGLAYPTTRSLATNRILRSSVLPVRNKLSYPPAWSSSSGFPPTRKRTTTSMRMSWLNVSRVSHTLKCIR